MPKNTGRGGKSYKRGKHGGPIKRDLLTKESDEGFEYGLVLKMLGNGRVLVKCFDEVERLGHIRGKMKKKVWIVVGDLVMCSLREEKQKCDIIIKYTPDEVRQLKAMNEVPQDLQIIDNEAGGAHVPGAGIEFAEKEKKEGVSSDEEDSISQASESDQEDLTVQLMGKKKLAQVDIDNI